MPQRTVPAPLTRGDQIRVIAPSCSKVLITGEGPPVATSRLEAKGLRVTFGEHVDECDWFLSSSIESRLADLHAAFADPDVAGILTVIGGYNANQLLPFIDWDLIAANPKVFCGYSDITALSCAIWAKTGLVTFSGPHWASFGMIEHFEDTDRWFDRMLFDQQPVEAEAARAFTDDAWFEHQHDRATVPNEGHWVMQPGSADGVLVGGNQCTFNLLHGTEYMPDLRGAVLFLEDDYEAHRSTVDRDLASITQQPGFDEVRAILIGRFQQSVEMSREHLRQIVANNPALRGLPVIGNVDFGHTYPLLTIPVGGRATVEAAPDGDDTNIIIST